jgi:hypothetical protein
MDADTPKSRTQAPRAEPPPTPSEAELSRIAREAVHQPADARLDKQLARMGLIDVPEGAETQAGHPAARAIAVDPELERLRQDLRRLRSILWALVGVIVVLAIAVVVLLIR